MQHIRMQIDALRASVSVPTPDTALHLFFLVPTVSLTPTRNPRIVLLIFVSGKIVLTGAKIREQIYTAFENIYPVLKEFMKQAQ